jgi:hypothetical protein
MRYKNLTNEKSRCVLCGKFIALNRAVKFAIDALFHSQPFRTLCKECENK